MVRNARTATVLGIAVLFAVAVVITAVVRFDAHQRRVQALNRSAASASAAWRAKRTAAQKISDARLQLRNRVDEIDRFSKSGDRTLGGIQVLLDKMRAFRDEKAMDEAIGSARVLNDSPDYVKARDAFTRTESSARDTITSVTTTMQAVVNNPFLAVGMANDFENLGKRLGTAMGDMARKTRRLTAAAAAAAETAHRKATSAQAAADAAARVNGVAAVLHP